MVLHRIVTGQRMERTAEILGRPLTERERHAMVVGEHAGVWETAFMLAERPEMVEPVYPTLGPLAPPRWKPLETLGRTLAARREARGGDATKLRTAFEGISGSIGWLLNARFGYGGPEVSYKGDPSVATAEIGHAFREMLAEDVLAVVEALVDGRTRPDDVRSIASDHAVIQPGFFGRLGAAAAVAAALLAWVS
jgi:hypothetical protein